MASTLRVLFVCLLPSEVDVLANALRKSGFEVIAEQVEEPNKLPTQLNNNYDLVLVDSLTKYPGLVETMLALLQQQSLDIPLLVYSSASDEALIVAAMKAGAQDFITSQNPQRLVMSVKRELAAVKQRAALNKDAQIDALLQEIDGLMLSGWDVAPIALRICQQAMTLFDLRLAWIGGKQADGSVGVVAAAGDVDYLDKIEIRWDGGPYAAGPVGTARSMRRVGV